MMDVSVCIQQTQYLVYIRTRFCIRNLRQQLVRKCRTPALSMKYLRSRYENATPNLCWVFCALLGDLCN